MRPLPVRRAGGRRGGRGRRGGAGRRARRWTAGAVLDGPGGAGRRPGGDTERGSLAGRGRQAGVGTRRTRQGPVRRRCPAGAGRRGARTTEPPSKRGGRTGRGRGHEHGRPAGRQAGRQTGGQADRRADSGRGRSVRDHCPLPAAPRSHRAATRRRRRQRPGQPRQGTVDTPRDSSAVCEAGRPRSGCQDRGTPPSWPLRAFALTGVPNMHAMGPVRTWADAKPRSWALCELVAPAERRTEHERRLGTASPIVQLPPARWTTN